MATAAEAVLYEVALVKPEHAGQIVVTDGFYLVLPTRASEREELITYYSIQPEDIEQKTEAEIHQIRRESKVSLLDGRLFAMTGKEVAASCCCLPVT